MNDVILTPLSVAGLALVACLGCTLMKKTNPAMALLFSLAAGGVLLLGAVFVLAPTLSFLRQLTETGSWPAEAVNVLFRALGIGLCCNLGCAACADCGEELLEQQVLFAGKVGLIAVGLPLFSELLTLATSFLQTAEGML